jgi:nucleoside-diphosphate-sugar epimerase
MAKAILVTGATGKQGGAVVDALLDVDSDGSQFTILALTRNASSPSAAKLLAKAPNGNLKVVQGNLDDVPAVFTSAKGLYPRRRQEDMGGVLGAGFSRAGGDFRERGHSGVRSN